MGPIAFQYAVVAVHMAKDVISGFQSENRSGEIRTAMTDRTVLVKDPGRRGVGDQDIQIMGDHVPFFSTCFAAWQGKSVTGTVVEYRLPGRSINFHARDNNLFILQVDSFRQKGFGPFRVSGQTMVVVAANHDLMFMGQLAQKTIKVFNIPCGPAVGHVACKDEYISGRDVELCMEGMGIAEQCDVHDSIERDRLKQGFYEGWK